MPLKADGTTPFYLKVNSNILGEASTNYQINSITFQTQVKELLGNEMIHIPNSNLEVNQSYEQKDLILYKSKEFCLQTASYIQALRFNTRRNITMKQRFVIDQFYDGMEIFVYPTAEVNHQKIKITSDIKNDILNGITIIADGRAPDIYGLEHLEELFYEEKSINISTYDGGSGLEEFYIEIINRETNSYQKYLPNDTWTISLLQENTLLFQGEYSIMIYAKDKVGNERVEGVKLQGDTLEAKFINVINSSSNEYKKGESGVLSIEATSYISRMDILFPAEFVQIEQSLNKVIYYEFPQYKITEEVISMIPLLVEEGEYIITVNTYKERAGTLLLSKEIKFFVKGNVLDQIRTRLK